jgi:glycosyltransferase involved in cell wall biosynthesis
LSVIVPVYNENATFDDMMKRLLNKKITGLDIEIIVVESGSTDGTHETAQKYAEHPRVILLQQDLPRGKGNAVRAALAKSKGDFILIQDADLEYDIDDYDALLKPLMRYRYPYVLGSRHTASSGWKIRRFGRRSLIALPMNLAHLFLAGLFNLLYGQSVRDPFTMFKVFRRDCITNMPFECDRFDFDCELVARLARRGYRPLEVPVNYQSRSFAAGKKIRFFRDPPTYMRAFLKYRFSSIDTDA